MHFRILVLAVLSGLAALLLPACQKSADDNSMLLAAGFLLAGSGCPSYNYNLPEGIPQPVVPAENCQTEQKVELGRHLFYDKRLSRDETMSCASCHFQERAFTDGKTRPRGIAHGSFPTGEQHPRNSQHLSNVAYHSVLTWNNPLLTTLESQARVPLFAESTDNSIVELGLQNDSYLEKLRADADYRELFRNAYGSAEDMTEIRVLQAIAAFQRTMMSFESDFDLFQQKKGSLSPAAIRGFQVFNGEQAECFHCHGGFNFTDTSFHGNSATIEVFFHNNGLYSDAEYSSKPTKGLEDISGKSEDRGKFRAPSLRNIARTMPYFHDGSVNCASPPSDGTDSAAMDACAREALTEIVDMYRAGGDAAKRGQPAGSAVDATLIRTFSITDSQRDDLVEFLISLTDDDFLTREPLSNPRPGNPLFGR